MKEPRLTEEAARNHDTWFPNHDSAFRKTDPEFIELFDNWAFDEVIRQSRLDTKTRLMMILASTIASRALGEYRVMLGAALTVGLTPVEIKEIVYHAVPYVGVANVVEFLRVTNEEFKTRGIRLPLEPQSTTTTETRFAQGDLAQRAIFGDAIERMRREAPRDEAHIHEYLATNCFGGYYTRGGIDLPTRELLTFALLVSLGGCDPQVRSHVVGNLGIGNDRSRLVDVLTQLLPYIGYPRTLNGLKAIDDAAPLASTPG